MQVNERQPIITCQNAYFNSGKYPITAVGNGIWKKENELVSTRSAYFRVSQKHTLKETFGAQRIDDCIYGILQKEGRRSVGNQSIVAGVNQQNG
jgi:hypothetical protein